MKIAMLGTGFIGRFYADALVKNRNNDSITSVYSRTMDSARKFGEDYQVSAVSDNMEEAINRDDVDIVCIALPNHQHEEAVMRCVEFGKAVMCTKPLGRNGAEALRMMKAVEDAGIFNGYLEDLVYTPKFMKAYDTIQQGGLGRILWAKSRETHPGPHSNWFWDKELAGGGAILDLGCHCIEISRTFIGKDILPVEVMCWADTQVKPIDAEDHAIGLVKYENGAIGQFEVSWTFRGGMDLRDEVMGEEGTIWINNFMRTGLEIFTASSQSQYVAEKAENTSGWLFPVGDEVHELGYPQMFEEMFLGIEKNTPVRETFYDGYVVNAIIDAAYKSAKTKQWEKPDLPVWRGKTGLSKNSHLTEYDENHFLIKEEMTHYGDKKVILKHKETGEISERVIA